MNFFSVLMKRPAYAAAMTAALPLLGMLLSPVPAEAAPSKIQAVPKKSLAAAPATSSKGKSAMPLFPVYVLDVPSTHQPFSVYLNGWLIDSSEGGEQAYFSSSKIGQYVADGTNTLTIHVLPSAPSNPVPNRFQVRIRSTEGEVFYYDWDPNAPTHPLPFTVDKHFTAHLPQPWAWQTAPKITLDAPTKQAINACLKRLYDALDSKNVDESVALFALSNHDHYLGRGQDVAEAEKNSRASWVERFASPGWRMYPIDYPHLRYELVANGRVVHVLRSDSGVPLINAAADPDGQHTAFDIFLCQVHGQWTVVR